MITHLHWSLEPNDVAFIAVDKRRVIRLVPLLPLAKVQRDEEQSTDKNR